ncbi:MAG TPA: thiamine phosphate synthase [Candidatus Binatia bacterium]|nr:thiamine phosphate synthase [Candidatus Binatia bacterium]
MILHAITADLETAVWAAANGASVVQLRLKGVDTARRVRTGREVLEALGERRAAVMVVMNDDVEAAVTLGIPVHLGQGDPGVERARSAGIGFGRSAASVDEARQAEAEGAMYIGAGAVWETPSKTDAGPAIGLEGLAAICSSVGIPVVAIGGIDSGNAPACIAAGASGVAVIRAVSELPRLRAALDATASGALEESR